VGEILKSLSKQHLASLPWIMGLGSGRPKASPLSSQRTFQWFGPYKNAICPQLPNPNTCPSAPLHGGRNCTHWSSASSSTSRCVQICSSFPSLLQASSRILLMVFADLYCLYRQCQVGLKMEALPRQNCGSPQMIRYILGLVRCWILWLFTVSLLSRVKLFTYTTVELE
jgi:hypothetical protein